MIETSKKTTKGTIHVNKVEEKNNWRESIQPLLPGKISDAGTFGTNYNTMPFHALGSGKIFSGFSSMTEWIIKEKKVLIDGYVGVFFDDIQQHIQLELQSRGLSVKWQHSSDFLRDESDIIDMTRPFMAGPEDVWGFKTNLSLKDFFKAEELSAISPDPSADINIVIGIGAAQVQWDAPIIYIDLPKNEIQYRMRAKSINNIGLSHPDNAFTIYKRFYFIDWVVLNDYKKQLLEKVSVFADGQRAGEITWILKTDFFNGLAQMSKTAFRARPWFEKGSWGGQWMKTSLDGLNNEEINYAWSFELITPENGLVFESEGNLLEVSFDILMMRSGKEVLGKHAEAFGSYFPIRFDFLDTFKGGNLSIQCHPSKKYIRETFGETITQDETYYIMDCEKDAKVYLGFQEDIDRDEFRRELERSESENIPVPVEKYVRSFPSHKHDLFLIPNGTVHSSGVNNMVLEISATPYIFTFKMYDWLALDLNGKPRPININHAFNNLNFERKGSLVEKELIADPVTIDTGKDWELIHLATHAEHFYDIHRLEFDTEIVIRTENVCHVLMLVEGCTISVGIEGEFKKYNYAETFIIPAAIATYTLVNPGRQRVKVIKAFLKNDISI